MGSTSRQAIKKNPMTANEALNLARRLATDRGWPWLEPVHVRKKRRWFRFCGWIIYSNADCLGSNVQVEIDNATAKVVSAAYLPR